MPQAILNGPLALVGAGIQVCTLTGASRKVENMKIGPDGARWSLQSYKDVVGITEKFSSFRHVSNVQIDHVCAGKGRWAFSTADYLLPRSVAFLHLTPPKNKKLAKGAGVGDEGEVFVHEFTSKELLEAYNLADVSKRVPSVWRREVGSSEEIAINFCLKHL
jgi:hypothetical protein